MDDRRNSPTETWKLAAGVGGVTGVLVGAIVLTMHDALYPRAHLFAESFLSTDRHISDPATVPRILISSGVLAVVVGLLLCAYSFWQPAFVRERIARLVTSIRRDRRALWIGLIAFVSTIPPIDLLQREDGIMEWLTALALLGSGVVTASLARLERGSDRWIVAGIAAVLLFVAMEEISWGQRIFGWTTPAAWAALNHQGETNLHNLVDLQWPSIIGALVAVMALVEGLAPEGGRGRLARFVPLPELAGFVPVIVVNVLMAIAAIPRSFEGLERLAAAMAVFVTLHLHRTRALRR